MSLPHRYLHLWPDGNGAAVLGSNVSDFIHVTGDGRTAPAGYADLPEATRKADTIDAGDGNDIVYAGNGGDTIDGGVGADTMYGGKGNDLYYVDSLSDVVRERSGGGIDGVVATVDFALGANVEQLDLTGAAVFGWGNGEQNSIMGSDAANFLYGGNGDDTIFGNGGDDVIYGGAGADEMTGGDGADTFYVDDPNDRVTDHGTDGAIDTVIASVTYVLPGYPSSSHVEDLTLAGAADIGGTGNQHANTIRGNAGNNVLSGMFGDDALIGGGGADTLRGGGDNDADRFVYSAVSDSTVAAHGRDTIKDFHHADGDLIDLFAIDANANMDGDQAFTLGGDAFTGTAGELIQYATGHGATILAGDVNGDSVADFAIELVHGVVIVPGDLIA